MNITAYHICYASIIDSLVFIDSESNSLFTSAQTNCCLFLLERSVYTLLLSYLGLNAVVYSTVFILLC